MYAKLLSAKKELAPAAEGSCAPCGGDPGGVPAAEPAGCTPTGFDYC